MSHRPRTFQKRSREEVAPPKAAAPATRPSAEDDAPSFEGSIAIDDIAKQVGVTLHPSLLTQLKDVLKFQSLFPIQVQTLAACLANKDVVARARTGSGKTLAFALPVLQKLIEKPRKDRKNPFAVVLSPTRELAMQSHKVFEGLVPAGTPIKSIAVYGGLHVSLQKKEIMNARGLDIIVGTPGRFIDFLTTGVIKLDDVKVVILDEADRMLDEGFADDVEKIMGGVPKDHQLLLFSATIPQWVDTVIKRFGRDASQRVNVDLVGENTVSVSETVSFFELLAYSREEKMLVMGDLIRVYAGRSGRVIIFCATKAECHDMGVSSVLRSDTQTLHGDMKQEEREKTMQAFRDGKFSVLIATDVASRGLDIPRIDLVIQTTVPMDGDSFIHRAGRTGRAGRRGVCIVFRNRFDNIYRLSHKCGITFQPLVAPTKGEVMSAISTDIAESIGTVDPTVVSWFQPAATALLEGKSPEESVEVVAKALALLAGYAKKEKARSLLGNRMGAVTVFYQCTDRNSFYFRRLGLGAVLGHIDEVVGPGAGRACRQVTTCGEGSPTGAYAVFDMDDAEGEKTVAKFKGVKDMKVEIIDTLPEGYSARTDAPRGYGGPQA